MAEDGLLSDFGKLMEEDLGKDAICLLLEQSRKDDGDTILLVLNVNCLALTVMYSHQLRRRRVPVLLFLGQSLSFKGAFIRRSHGVALQESNLLDKFLYK